jgi:toxin ParE1/3/4
MPHFLVQHSASCRINDIYCYTFDQWGSVKAESYITGLFNVFENLGTCVLSRPIPAEFGVNGFFCRYEKHFIYWKYLSNGTVGIVTVLHERMHQIERFNKDFSMTAINDWILGKPYR